jgi:hypothetical protein
MSADEEESAANQREWQKRKPTRKLMTHYTETQRKAFLPDERSAEKWRTRLSAAKQKESR